MDVIRPITLFCPQGDGFFVFIYCVSVFTHSRTIHQVLEDSALSVGVGGSRVSSRQSWTPPGSPGEQSDVETSDFRNTCQSSEIGVYGVSREPRVYSPLLLLQISLGLYETGESLRVGVRWGVSVSNFFNKQDH